jgi:hypothetical protein
MDGLVVIRRAGQRKAPAAGIRRRVIMLQVAEVATRRAAGIARAAVAGTRAEAEGTTSHK